MQNLALVAGAFLVFTVLDVLDFAQQETSAPSSQSQTTQPTGNTLTNRDVTEMLQAGLTPEVVIAKITNSPCEFDTSPAVLIELKGAGVPDAVILAMVQASTKIPSSRAVVGPAQQNNQPASFFPPGGNERYARCGTGGGEVFVLGAPGAGLPAVTTLKCGERIAVLTNQTQGSGVFAIVWYKIRTADGKEGYVPQQYLSESYVSSTPSRVQTPTLPQTAFLPPNTVRALGYRVIPQQRTTYYQGGQNSSYTSCYGQGQWYDYGSIGNLNMTTNCHTSYSSPTQIPITWQFADVYNVVETGTNRYVIGCRANWRWSNCSPLIPGDLFGVEVKGGNMWVTASKDGKKQTRIKYNILQLTRK